MRPLLLQQARKRRERPCLGECPECRSRRRDKLRLPQINQRRGDAHDEKKCAHDSEPALHTACSAAALLLETTRSDSRPRPRSAAPLVYHRQPMDRLRWIAISARDDPRAESHARTFRIDRRVPIAHACDARLDPARLGRRHLRAADPVLWSAAIELPNLIHTWTLTSFLTLMGVPLGAVRCRRDSVAAGRSGARRQPARAVRPRRTLGAVEPLCAYSLLALAIDFELFHTSPLSVATALLVAEIVLPLVFLLSSSRNLKAATTLAYFALVLRSSCGALAEGVLSAPRRLESVNYATPRMDMDMDPPSSSAPYSNCSASRPTIPARAPAPGNGAAAVSESRRSILRMRSRWRTSRSPARTTWRR